MKLAKLSLVPLAGIAGLAYSALLPTAITFHPLVSSDSKNCYMDAVKDATNNRFQPALAKLEALLMVDPVTVGIDKANLPSEARGYEPDVLKGIAIWQNALPDCPYLIARDSKTRPTVLIKFVRSINNQGGDLQGMIEAQHEFKWNGSQHTSQLIGTMYVVYRTGGRKLTGNEVSEVVAHELGHLLGLTDAPTTTGLMGPFVAGSPRLAPSPGELEAVRQFRQQVKSEIDTIEDDL